MEGRVLPHSIPGLKYSFMTENSYVDGNSEDVTVCAVEELVLDHYKNHGYPEGELWRKAYINKMVSML